MDHGLTGLLVQMLLTKRCSILLEFLINDLQKSLISECEYREISCGAKGVTRERYQANKHARVEDCHSVRQDRARR